MIVMMIEPRVDDFIPTPGAQMEGIFVRRLDVSTCWINEHWIWSMETVVDKRNKQKCAFDDWMKNVEMNVMRRQITHHRHHLPDSRLCSMQQHMMIHGDGSLPAHDILRLSVCQ